MITNELNKIVEGNKKSIKNILKYSMSVSILFVIFYIFFAVKKVRNSNESIVLSKNITNEKVRNYYNENIE